MHRKHRQLFVFFEKNTAGLLCSSQLIARVESTIFSQFVRNCSSITYFDRWPCMCFEPEVSASFSIAASIWLIDGYSVTPSFLCDSWGGFCYWVEAVLIDSNSAFFSSTLRGGTATCLGLGSSSVSDCGCL